MQDFTYINKELGTAFKGNDEINWIILSKDYTLSEVFIDKFQNKLNWYWLSCNQPLSEEFIEKYQDKVYWHYISTYQKLSEEFIEKFQDKVYWHYISKYQTLSEPFIEKFKDKVSWKNISKYQKLSDSFIESHNLALHKGNLWQYQPTEFKKQKLIKTGKYECHDDYFIAYKAIRNDRYSLYNFQYQYLPGETYESTCDCTNDENSFGLNVGTYDFAKDYLDYNKGIIVKCKISYEDVGRIVHDGEKIRCFKITVLE